MSGLGAVNRTTLREQVLAQLRESILDGTLPPGTKMAEVDLAAQFGVSRGTVREALRYLQQSGLLEGEERLSLRVRRLSPVEIVELFNVRAALEGQAMRDIINNPDRERLIDELEKRLPVVESEMPYAQRFLIDLQFHEELCRLGGNSVLLTMWESVKDLMRMAVIAPEDEESVQLMSPAHHRPILDALRAGDPDRALTVIRDHMGGAAQSWAARAQLAYAS